VVIALCAFALAGAGLDRFTLDIGEAAFARTALAGIDDPELTQALAGKDAGAVADRVRALDLAPARARLVEALPSLYGGREVIARARRLVAGSGEARAALARLAALVAKLEARGLGDHLTLDLGEVGGFDYYTGARFHGFAPGAGGALASGGRYDHLIERYGAAAPAAGFAVDVDQVARALAARGPRPAPAPSGILIGGAADTVAKLADALRRRGKVVVEAQGAARSLRAEMARGGYARAIWIEGRGGTFWDAAGATGAISEREIASAIRGKTGRIGG
jgi:ATP phosphoribosyltransferase regulatory subunit